MSKIKILSAVLLIFMLGACGGGGGGTSKTTPIVTVPASLSVTVPELPEFKESSEYVVNLNVNYTGKTTLSYVVNSSSSNIMVAVNGSALTITTLSVAENEAELSLSVTVSDGTLSKTVDVSAPLINSSLADSVALAEAMSQKASQLVEGGSQELLAVNAYLIEQAYMLGNITSAERVELTEIVRLAAENYLAQISNDIAPLQSMSAKFNDKVLTDDEAASILSGWDSTLTSAVASLISLNSLYNSYDMFGIPIPVIASLIETDVYSLYKGNEALGSFTVDDKWEYAEAYNYLNLLIGDSTMTCPVEG
jgi:hypothetical protein